MFTKFNHQGIIKLLAKSSPLFASIKLQREGKLWNIKMLLKESVSSYLNWLLRKKQQIFILLGIDKNSQYIYDKFIINVRGGIVLFKRSILSFLALILILTIITGQEIDASNQFPDVNNYQDEIEYLTSKEIISGYPDGTFKPTRNLTRLQAVTMILREKGIKDYTAPNPNFTDLQPGDHGYAIVAKAVELGFIGGKTARDGSKYFDPAAPLTRGQMSKILAEGYDLPKIKDVTFKDVSVGNGYRDYVSALASNNITTGYLDDTFRPNVTISRQHFAAFMARMLDDKFKPQAKQDLKVHYIDVGQGDSTLIQTPDGANILIDAGIKSAGQKVVNFLKEKDVGKLDVVVATHPHADHIGGLITVLNTFKVDKFIDSGKVHTSQTYVDLLTLIDNENIPFEVAQKGKVYTFDNGFKMTTVHADSKAENLNNASVSLKVEYNKISFMLTGDAEKDAEDVMVNSKFNLDSTIYKAGHHGSNTSSTQPFIDKVNPEVTILSYGKGNSYGHPHEEVVKRLQAAKSKLYSTESGDVTVTTNGITYNITAKKWIPPVINPKPEPEKPTPTPTPKPDPSPTYPVNINTASHDELQNITGVGSVIAQRIIDYRKKHGRFTSKTQLKNVKGIGDATYKKMESQITI